MKFHHIIIIFALFIALCGCHKPNPNPELLDPIYDDLEKEKKDLLGRVAALEKTLEEQKQELSKVKPQTGQIKYAQKRVNETAAQLEKLKQQYFYYELRAKTRLKEDKLNYLKAFNKNEPWPKPEEYKEYLSQKSLEKTSRVWSAKDRIEEFNRQKNPKPSGHGEH